MCDLEDNNIRVHIDTRSSTIAYDPDGNTILLSKNISEELEFTIESSIYVSKVRQSFVVFRGPGIEAF